MARRKCYRTVTVINDSMVFLGRVLDPMLVEKREDVFRIILVRTRRFINVRDVIGKECATVDDLPEIARILFERGILRGAEHDPPTS